MQIAYNPRYHHQHDQYYKKQDTPGHGKHHHHHHHLLYDNIIKNYRLTRHHHGNINILRKRRLLLPQATGCLTVGNVGKIHLRSDTCPVQMMMMMI